MVVDCFMIQTNSSTGSVFQITVVIPTIFQEELTTFREILIKPGWYKITVCLDGYCLVGEWLSEQTQ